MARQVAAGLSGWVPLEAPTTGEAAVEALRAVLRAAHPDLAGQPLRMLGSGWDCLAAAVGGVVLKLPRHERAEEALRREARLLALLGRRLPIPVPAPRLVEAPRLHSLHSLIPGAELLRPAYEALAEPARDRLAADLAAILAAIHETPVELARSAGVPAAPPWRPADAVARAVLSLLPEDLRSAAARVLEKAEALGPDPWGEGLGHLDAHGWNMAWDAERERLNGLLDFGDAGVGPLHRELVQPSLLSFDLSRRLGRALGALKGLEVDDRRACLLAARRRLEELAEDGGGFARAMATEGVRAAEEAGFLAIPRGRS